MPPFSTAPYNMFGMPTKGGKQFKKAEKNSSSVVRKETPKPEEKAKV